MKNRSFFSSVKCAYKGLVVAMKSEKNFMIYAINVAITIPINIFMHFSILQWVTYMICVIGVFSAECLNTSIEKLCDFLVAEHNDNIKFIKDVAAGAVLCWGIAFYAVEIIMIGVGIFGY